MNRAWRLPLVVILALLWTGASIATATSVHKFSLRDLTKRSSAIVMAKVEDSYSRWENREIYTYFTLRVLQPVKGMKGQATITLRQLGGRVDNIESIVPGMPKFRSGEEVVVFLTQTDAAGYPWVMGLEQGKYTITSDANGNKSVRNEIGDLNRLLPDGTLDKSPSVSPELPLGAFLDGIKTDLNEAGKVQVDPTTPTR
ncbi:MAG TPA: hypothetical protein VID50_00155 [Candidatus Eisenbacteria bacterium]